MKLPIVLFSPNTGVALDSVVFEIPAEGQLTLLTTGIPEGEFITFEALRVSGNQRAKICGCRLTSAVHDSIEAVQELQCPACEPLVQRPVRATPQNPVVILDVPHGTLLRAIYHGDGLEQRVVHAWLVESATQDLTDSMRGCPPIFYPEDEQTWTDTGQFRCLPDETTVEYEQRNECGRLRWFPDPERPQRWVDACCPPRCLPDGETVEIQQVNQCGDLRWVESEQGQIWTDTGNIRCLPDQVGVEFEQTNQCGDRRWQLSETIEQVWIDSATVRCLDDEVGIEILQTNQCGDQRWELSLTREQRWQPTGVHRCGELVVELQEVNDCGHTRWVECGPVAWTDTANTRCNGDVIEVEQTNQCGHRRWAETGEVTWTDTGVIRCVGGVVESEQVNQCGGRRWEEIGPVTWTDTGEVRCVGDTLETQQSDDCGNTRWIESGGVTWTPTGETRCEGEVIEIQEVNDCGQFRWTATEEPCDVEPPSTHSILSIVPVDDPIIEGEGACWEVTLDAPVAGANLSINFTLSGSEQVVHAYPAPSLNIAIGNDSGIVCVATTDDGTDEDVLNLCLTAVLSSRVLSAPPASCIEVQDNDETEPSDSIHTVLSVTVDPESADEGTEFCWTVTLDSPVANSPLTVNGVLSGSEQVIHGYANPSGVIAIGNDSVVLCVETTDDFDIESIRDLCLTVQLSPRITAAPAAVCAQVVDNDAIEPATLPASIGGLCIVDNPSTGISEFFVTFLADGTVRQKTIIGIGYSSYTWLPPGESAADYEARIDDLSDPALTASGPTLGAWHNLGVTRDFRWAATGPGPNSGNVNGTVRIRRVGEVVDDDTVVMDPTFVGVNVECP